MNTNKKIELQWYGPFSVWDLLSNPENEKQFAKPGVYLWVERRQNRLCYVGRSLSNVLNRQKEHNAKQISGLYIIPNEYRKSATEDWVPNQKENIDILFSLERFMELITDAFSYRDDLDIYLCPLNESKEMLKALELNLLFSLQPYGTKMGRSSPPKLKLDIVHINAIWRGAVAEEYRTKVAFR